MDSITKCFGCYQKNFITCTKWCNESNECKKEYGIKHGAEEIDKPEESEEIGEPEDQNKEMGQNITKKKRGRPRKNTD